MSAPAYEAFPVPRLRQMDGEAELAVATAAASARSRPEAVTAILRTLLDDIGGVAASEQTVRALPSAAREWLLQWTAAKLRPDIRWFEANCIHCGEPFDVSIDLSQPRYSSPDKSAGEVSVETSIGTRRFTVPTGEHEERSAGLPTADDPRRVFAGLCGLSDTATEDAACFDAHDLALIDEALEAASPDIADEVRVECPACAKETGARIDPLAFGFPREADILREIHLIARGYGWPLGDILALPGRQRAWFAGKIAEERRTGLRGAGRA